jgi:DNA-binding transcriptional LysR family regulator
MTLQQLKYLLVMSEVLNFTKAADQLHISQPSLSYAISELEKELGVQLFDRHGNHTFMTKYCDDFLPYVKQIFTTLHDGKASLSKLLDASTGKVSLGYIYSVSFDFVPRALENFYAIRGNGQITFEFFQGLHSVLIEKLKAGGLDLLISANPRQKAIAGIPLFKQELFVVVPETHRLAGKEDVELSDIKDEPLITLSTGSDIRNHIIKCFDIIGAKPIIAGEVAECIGLSALVQANLGIAITPLFPDV